MVQSGFAAALSDGWDFWYRYQLVDYWKKKKITWWELQQDEVINKFLAHFIDDGTIIGFVDEEVSMRSINSTEKLRNTKQIKTFANCPHFEGRISREYRSEKSYLILSSD